MPPISQSLLPNIMKGKRSLLIEATLRDPFDGIGKPEALKENLSGFYSRRIDDTNRLVYAVRDSHVTIISCRYHY